MEAPHRLDFSTDHVTNVASVAQYSPFRYPGGKTWLVPTVRRILMSMGFRARVFIDPFAGGGIIPLTVAFEELAAGAVLGELDPDVASVWRAILAPGGASWLANRIMEFPMNRENVEAALSGGGRTVRERAFRTLLRNRVQRGGIMAPGAGLVKNGENGRGLASRWYPETLANRIKAIGSIKRRLRFFEYDAFKLIAQYSDHENAVFFIDPPYTAGGKRAGKRLYRYNQVDHGRLFEQISTVRGAAILTYDDSDEINTLARQYRFDTCIVAMKNTHHTVMRELVVIKY